MIKKTKDYSMVKNDIIDSVRRQLQKAKEPYILMFRDKNGNLRMLTHDDNTELLKNILRAVLNGLEEGEVATPVDVPDKLDS